MNPDTLYQLKLLRQKQLAGIPLTDEELRNAITLLREARYSALQGAAERKSAPRVSKPAASKKQALDDLENELENL